MHISTHGNAKNRQLNTQSTHVHARQFPQSPHDAQLQIHPSHIFVSIKAYLILSLSY